MLTLALDSMRKTVEAIKEAGLRESTKIMIGGNPVSKEAMIMVGADAWSKNPQLTTQISLEWLNGKSDQ